jgi:hypothetical protein
LFNEREEGIIDERDQDAACHESSKCRRLIVDRVTFWLLLNPWGGSIQFFALSSLMRYSRW